MNFNVTEGWWLTHLIRLDPEWQANIANEDAVAIGTGLTPEEAIESANLKAAMGMTKTKYIPLNFSDLITAKANISNLMGLLGLNREPLKRRRVD